VRALTLLALLIGCGPKIPEDTDTDVDTDTEPDPEPVIAPDYAAAGPAEAATDTGSFAAGEGCTLNYTRFRPDGARGEVLVLLVHGFARTQAQMAGWGAHWASWGAEVVTPQMCRLGLTNTDHPANGRHLAALADHLADGRPVILAGYSAGGLAAVLAAPAVGPVGVLGLDAVDNNDLGVAAAAGIAAPVAGLFAEPAQCNASGNGVAMIGAAADSTAIKVLEADHCSYESPTDRLCTTLCRRGDRDDEAIELAIRALSTSFVAWRGGLLPEAQQWWTPGDPKYDGLSGRIERL
jgi:dienelactone hydrolase